MKLLYQTHSPYARKVLVMAHEAGLAGRIEVIHHETSPTRRNEAVFAANPLGKVPVLICEDGLALFDSVAICDHLDQLHDGPRLIPPAGRARALTLRLQALAQGLADAGIALRWETARRPETLRYPPLAEGQAAKLVAAYDFVEREVDLHGPVDLGRIALATALSWLEFRDLPSFRPGRPRLSTWFDAFSRRPSMRATPLSGETHD
ncbi:glutathione S-transferase family protein [Inquilinus sp. NPDC058860]|uniref:glutathione S-transferase family protein n=1 Tax=Inquilinus sp. NPDC058860 TaxID=3346652 RepID=UPI0036A6CD96